MCKVFLGCHAPKIIKICQFSPSYSKNRAGFGGRIVNQQNMSIYIQAHVQESYAE